MNILSRDCISSTAIKPELLRELPHLRVTIIPTGGNIRSEPFAVAPHSRNSLTISPILSFMACVMSVADGSRSKFVHIVIKLVLSRSGLSCAVLIAASGLATAPEASRMTKRLTFIDDLVRPVDSLRSCCNVTRKKWSAKTRFELEPVVVVVFCTMPAKFGEDHVLLSITYELILQNHRGMYGILRASESLRSRYTNDPGSDGIATEM